MVRNDDVTGCYYYDKTVKNTYNGMDGKEYYSWETLEEADKRHELFRGNWNKFVFDVDNNTKKMIPDAKADGEEVIYQIVGPDFKKEEIVSQYGTTVYDRLLSYRGVYAYLVLEGIGASPLISIGTLTYYLKTLKNIPSYVDYSDMTFHFNASKESVKEEETTSKK
jgi:hypothetical protein